MKYKKYFRKTSLKQKGHGDFFLNEILKKKPKFFLEIGVFHGVTARNVCELLQNIHGKDFKYIGLDLFEKNNERFSKEYFNHHFVEYSKLAVEQFTGDFQNTDLVINTSSEHMNDLPELIKNKLYNRRQLHDQYGGNRQNGISNCKGHPIILILQVVQVNNMVMKTHQLKKNF